MSAASSSLQPSSRRRLLRRLWVDYLAPRRALVLTALACAVIVAVCSAGLAKQLEPAINDVLVAQDRRLLWLVPLGFALTALVRTLAQLGQAWAVNRVGHSVVGDIQVRLFGTLIRADLARLRQAHTGSYLSSVLYDAGLIREAATAGVVNYTQNALIVLGAFLVMLTQDAVLTGIVLVAFPLVSWTIARFARATRKAARGAMAETSALSTAVMESLDGVKIVKIDTREAAEEARVAEVVARRQRHVIRGADVRAAAAPVTELISTLVAAAVIAYAGWRATQGGMNVGEFFSFFGALLMASQSLRQLANLQTVMSEGLTAAARVFDALDVQPEVRESPTARRMTGGAYTVRLETVSFAYGPATTPAVDGVTLEAARAKVTALVGPSGGGKSTLLNLIPRFYDPTGGRVTIDGADVRGLTLASLRGSIALVTQEPFLFDDTVRANIAYARPEATSAEVESAARAAAAHAFVTALPQGYDTPVGEAGARLSGGQRQRIAIARAFLKNAPILLLDEATSALDTESEAQVAAALERLMSGRTVLMIAHRLSTVRRADAIYVIDGGRVVEQGTHDALVRQGGLYARLARQQDLSPDPAALTEPSA